MAASNTIIQIKRSSTTTIPSGLKAGELAYSYLSNTFFLGNSTGTGVVNVGGLLYTQTIDNATSANTGNTLVKRASDGSFAGQLYGTANLAIATVSNNTFQISGGDITASAQYFQGNNNVTLNASLNTIAGLTPGYYGNPTSIPTIQIGANGRILSVTTNVISSNITVSGNTGSSVLQTGNVFTIVGNGTGIVATETANGSGGANVVISTDNTIARTNTSAVGTQVFNTDLSLPTNNMSVGGTLTVSNLAVSGNITYANSISTLNITDPIIYLASNNSGNLVDIGFVGHFVGTGHTGGTSLYQHTGFVRDYNDNKWKLFSNVINEPGTTVTFDGNTYYDIIKVGGVDAANGNVYGISTVTANTGNLIALGVSGTANIATLGVSGVTNLSSLGVTTANIGGLTVTNTTNTATLGVSGVANITSLGVGTNANIAALTVINTANIATLGVSGVSNLNSLGAVTANISALTVSGVANISSLGITNANVVNLGVSGVANIVSLGVSTNANIASLTLGTPLLVSSGGTGLNSITTNGVTFGNGTGNLGVTAAAGSADQTWSNQILTVTNAGVPVWTTTMDGGTF